ncbi:MAG: PSD1 domain-containing protein [Acidobacteria bacterium]|nr:PSD1 domain-containing protein [Acidobacteriota bacterium]
MRNLWRILALPALALHGQEAAEGFATRIQPVLVKECQGCHGGSMALSKLDLRTRESMLLGGSRGPAVIPGNAADSLLLRVLEARDGLQMPPGDASKRLPAETIASIRTWINAGAPWTGTTNSNWGHYKPEDLWAIRPLPPQDKSKTVDSFLQSGSMADRRTLIRRVSIDLTGLPPTLSEIEAFVNDRSPQAWAKVVERLLASPRYGERWARHWLDVVRYADTAGYSNDFERPNAWRYRDYVVRAFNQDKPYDQFIREQIAGDELYPGNAEALIATGFLRMGPWEHTAMSVEAVTRQMFLDDVTHSTAATFLGLTLGCARCHDHKFDPLPTKDYYRMQAIFAVTEFVRPPAPFLPSENTSGLAAGKTHMRDVAAQAKRRMDELGAGNKQRENPDLFEEFKLYQKHTALYKESLDRFEPKAFAVSSGPIDGATDGGPNLRYPKAANYKPAQVHVLPGGNIQSPAETVKPGVLSLLERYGSYPSPAVPETTSGRRSALANWIADARNPLTARVMVNRMWQYHFGKGIAEDANNFGKMGKKPSNPELLDWLAGGFMENSWSIKSVHRSILLSNAYQSASLPPRRVEAEVLRDSILAVTGELSLDTGGPGTYPQINDDVARQAQHRMGSLAPAYRASPAKRDRNRRTIYTFQQRSLIDPMVEVFNGPSLDLSCERRDSSTVPTQAFTLFNGQFVHDMALALAAKLGAQSPKAQIRSVFERVLGRVPDAPEEATALASLRRLTRLHSGTPPTRPVQTPVVHTITSELTGAQHQFVHQEDPATFEHNLHPSETTPAVRALADVILALLNSNEFAYVY